MPRLNPFAKVGVKCTRRWEATLDDAIEGLAWSGNQVAGASISGPIHVFDANTGTVQAKMAGHGLGTAGIGWAASGKHFASVGQDGKVRFWNTTNGTELRAVDGGAPWVEHLAWSNVDDFLATAAGKKIRLWNGNGELVREYADHSHTVTALAWKPGANVLASAGYGQLRQWSPDSSSPVVEWTPKTSVIALAWSPNGTYLATGNQDDSVHFWILEKNDNLEMTGYPSKVKVVSWDATSQYLATSGADMACVWDCSGKGPEGTTPIQLQGHENLVTTLAFQHAGKILATGGEDGKLLVWQPGKQATPIAKAELGAPVTKLIWTQDDRTLLVGTAEGKVVSFSVG